MGLCYVIFFLVAYEVPCDVESSEFSGLAEIERIFFLRGFVGFLAGVSDSVFDFLTD